MLINYSIESLNNDLEKLIQNNQINSLSALALSDESKLSVTLRPMKEYNNVYHGLHPSFDVSMLKIFLSKYNVNNPIEFWDAISLEQASEQYFNFIVTDT